MVRNQHARRNPLDNGAFEQGAFGQRYSGININGLHESGLHHVSCVVARGAKTSDEN